MKRCCGTLCTAYVYDGQGIVWYDSVFCSEQCLEDYQEWLRASKERHEEWKRRLRLEREAAAARQGCCGDET